MTANGERRPPTEGEAVPCCGSTERDRCGPIHARGCPTYEGAWDYGEVWE